MGWFDKRGFQGVLGKLKNPKRSKLPFFLNFAQIVPVPASREYFPRGFSSNLVAYYWGDCTLLFSQLSNITSLSLMAGGTFRVSREPFKSGFLFNSLYPLALYNRIEYIKYCPKRHAEELLRPNTRTRIQNFRGAVTWNSLLKAGFQLWKCDRVWECVLVAGVQLFSKQCFSIKRI